MTLINKPQLVKIRLQISPLAPPWFKAAWHSGMRRPPFVTVAQARA